MSSRDVESMGTAGDHSNKCVYVCLACLTLTLLSSSALMFVFVKGLEKQIILLNSSLPNENGNPSTLFAPATGSPSYKSRNFAYVRAVKAVVGNLTMEFDEIEFGRSSSIGSNFKYSEEQRKLTVLSSGSYFIYMNLQFKRTTMGSGTITVTLTSENDELLSCEVLLPESQDTITKKCWDVVPHLESNSNLVANMIVHSSHPKDEQFGWKLASNESGFGVFLIDSP